MEPPARELELALAEVVAVWPDSDEARFWLGICRSNVPKGHDQDSYDIRMWFLRFTGQRRQGKMVFIEEKEGEISLGAVICRSVKLETARQSGHLLLLLPTDEEARIARTIYEWEKQDDEAEDATHRDDSNSNDGEKLVKPKQEVIDIDNMPDLNSTKRPPSLDKLDMYSVSRVIDRRVREADEGDGLVTEYLVEWDETWATEKEIFVKRPLKPAKGVTEEAIGKTGGQRVAKKGIVWDEVEEIIDISRNTPCRYRVKWKPTWLEEERCPVICIMLWQLEQESIKHEHDEDGDGADNPAMDNDTTDDNTDSGTTEHDTRDQDMRDSDTRGKGADIGAPVQSIKTEPKDEDEYEEEEEIEASKNKKLRLKRGVRKKKIATRHLSYGGMSRPEKKPADAPLPMSPQLQTEAVVTPHPTPPTPQMVAPPLMQTPTPAQTETAATPQPTPPQTETVVTPPLTRTPTPPQTKTAAAPQPTPTPPQTKTVPTPPRPTPTSPQTKTAAAPQPSPTPQRTKAVATPPPPTPTSPQKKTLATPPPMRTPTSPQTKTVATPPTMPTPPPTETAPLELHVEMSDAPTVEETSIDDPQAKSGEKRRREASDDARAQRENGRGTGGEKQAMRPSKRSKAVEVVVIDDDDDDDEAPAGQPVVTSIASRRLRPRRPERQETMTKPTNKTGTPLGRSSRTTSTNSSIRTASTAPAPAWPIAGKTVATSVNAQPLSWQEIVRQSLSVLGTATVSQLGDYVTQNYPEKPISQHTLPYIRKILRGIGETCSGPGSRVQVWRLRREGQSEDEDDLEGEQSDGSGSGEDAMEQDEVITTGRIDDLQALYARGRRRSFENDFVEEFSPVQADDDAADRATALQKMAEMLRRDIEQGEGILDEEHEKAALPPQPQFFPQRGPTFAYTPPPEPEVLCVRFNMEPYLLPFHLPVSVGLVKAKAIETARAHEVAPDRLFQLVLAPSRRSAANSSFVSGQDYDDDDDSVEVLDDDDKIDGALLRGKELVLAIDDEAMNAKWEYSFVDTLLMKLGPHQPTAAWQPPPQWLWPQDPPAPANQIPPLNFVQFMASTPELTLDDFFDSDSGTISDGGDVSTTSTTPTAITTTTSASTAGTEGGEGISMDYCPITAGFMETTAADAPPVGGADDGSTTHKSDDRHSVINAGAGASASSNNDDAVEANAGRVTAMAEGKDENENENENDFHYEGNTNTDAGNTTGHYDDECCEIDFLSDDVAPASHDGDGGREGEGDCEGEGEGEGDDEKEDEDGAEEQSPDEIELNVPTPPDSSPTPADSAELNSFSGQINETSNDTHFSFLSSYLNAASAGEVSAPLTT